MGSGFFAENTPSSVKHRERIVPSQRNQARYSIVILINTRSRKTSEMIQPAVGVSLIADPGFSSCLSRIECHGMTLSAGLRNSLLIKENNKPRTATVVPLQDHLLWPRRVI